MCKPKSESMALNKTSNMKKQKIIKIKEPDSKPTSIMINTERKLKKIFSQKQSLNILRWSQKNSQDFKDPVQIIY